MADAPTPLTTTTTHYGWTKPDIGASDDAWGGQLNADLDSIDSVVFGIQGSVPGPSITTPAMDGTGAVGVSALFARADHVHPTDTSRYAASNPSGYQTAAQVAAAVPAPSSTTPAMDGTAAVGTGATWARADHVHPTDTSRAAASALAGYLPLTGGTLSGALTPSQTAGVVGTTTNNNANAGAVGEFISAARTTNLACPVDGIVNIISISVTAGDWDVEGWADADFTGTAMNYVEFAISTTSLTLPSVTSPGDVGLSSLGAAASVALATGSLRLSVAATTTVYLVGTTNFTGGTCNMQGIIQARRRR